MVPKISASPPRVVRGQHRGSGVIARRDSPGATVRATRPTAASVPRPGDDVAGDMLKGGVGDAARAVGAGRRDRRQDGPATRAFQTRVT
jgi:hypothetical protein